MALSTIEVECFSGAPADWDLWQAEVKYPSFFQSSSWATFQSRNGIKPTFYVAHSHEAGKPVSGALVLISGDRAMCWEGPWNIGGDGVDGSNAILQAFDQLCIREWKVFLPIGQSSEVLTLNDSWEVVPECFSTSMVDLSLSADEIWAHFSPSARRNIHRGEATGLEFRLEGREEVADFQRLMGLLPDIDEWGHFPERFFPALVDLPGVHLLSCRYRERMVSAAIVGIFNRRAVYLFGATDRAYSHTRPSEFLHYNVMKWLRNKGIDLYDLGYVSKAPGNARRLGISRFKGKLGGLNYGYTRLSKKPSEAS